MLSWLNSLPKIHYDVFELIFIMEWFEFKTNEASFYVSLWHTCFSV